jgi:hypothetical protein
MKPKRQTNTETRNVKISCSFFLLAVCLVPKRKKYAGRTEQWSTGALEPESGTYWCTVLR